MDFTKGILKSNMKFVIVNYVRTTCVVFVAKVWFYLIKKKFCYWWFFWEKKTDLRTSSNW